MSKAETIIEFEKEFDDRFGMYVDRDGCIRGGSNEGSPLSINEVREHITDLLYKQHEHTLSLVKLRRVPSGKSLMRSSAYAKGINDTFDRLEQLKEKLK